MSQENLEFLVDYLQRGTDGGVDAVAEFWDPDITWRAAEGAIDDVGEMHGAEAVRRYIQDWFACSTTSPSSRRTSSTPVMIVSLQSSA